MLTKKALFLFLFCRCRARSTRVHTAAECRTRCTPRNTPPTLQQARTPGICRQSSPQQQQQQRAGASSCQPSSLVPAPRVALPPPPPLRHTHTHAAPPPHTQRPTPTHAAPQRPLGHLSLLSILLLAARMLGVRARKPSLRLPTPTSADVCQRKLTQKPKSGLMQAVGAAPTVRRRCLTV
jgi:hypothetical protein